MSMNGRIATSLAMVVLFAFFVAQAFFFRHEAAVMPLLVGLPGLILSLAQLIVEMRAHGGGNKDEPIISGQQRTIMLWIAGFTLGVIAFGFVLGAPLLLAAYLYFAAEERLGIAVAGGVLCLALMYGLEHLLHIPLFEGLVIHYLF
jgi:hypothetical protein